MKFCHSEKNDKIKKVTKSVIRVKRNENKKKRLERKEKRKTL